MFDRIAKAIIGGLGAAAGAYALAVQHGQVTVADWVTIVVTGVGAGVAVWATPNAPAKTEEPTV